LIARVDAQTGGLSSVEFSADGQRIVSASASGVIQVWDARTMRVVSPIVAHRGAAYGAVFALDGHRLITGGEDGVARVWDARTGGLLSTLDARGGVMTAAMAKAAIPPSTKAA